MDVANQNVGTNVVKDEVGERCQSLFQEFLEKHEEYSTEARNLEEKLESTMVIDFQKLEEYDSSLAATITEDYYRVYPYLCRALKLFLHDRIVPHDSISYYVGFTGITVLVKVRELKMRRNGRLISIKGQVTRTSPVYPELVSGTFICRDCQTLIKDVEQEFRYTEPTMCSNPVCSNRNNFILDENKSKFVDLQKVRIQEVQAELPPGMIPRSVEVVLRADCVEKAQAGDLCVFNGTLISVPDVSQLSVPGARIERAPKGRASDGYQNEGIRGLKALGVRELSYRQAVLAYHVEPTGGVLSRGLRADEEMTIQEMKKRLSDEGWMKISEMFNDKNLYDNLCKSLFPTIHGNDEVKKGILLLLFGGVPKTAKEGSTHLRGDLNACIVGDPSTAKSQLLKMVKEFSPRAIYTSGKASTAAGITAAVVKDEETHEFVIEAGALMLADNGVCCIDEFDKMDAKDQVAIHEAMEQQTISIAKAGVRATLNARTSVLAAANPIGGRYDRSKSLRQNIALSAPLLSRFDLFFILVDECSEIVDYSVARIMVDLHCKRTEQEAAADKPPYSYHDIRQYLFFVRQLKPTLTPEAGKYMVEEYARMRKRDCSGVSKSSWRITVRQLESMIRLSEAMARLHCEERVLKKHVKEAVRLLNTTIITVEMPDVQLEEEEEEEVEEEPMEQEEAEDKENAPPAGGQGTAAKHSSKITYEKYKQMANMLVIHLKQSEESATAEDDAADASCGLRKSQLVDWYMESVLGELETEEEFETQKATVEKIISRLINIDRIIIQLTQVGLQPQEKGEAGPAQETDPVLVVHPNYTISD